MEIKWLEDFVSLANTRSFSRSAVERRVTQSAFSRRIQQLEQWLGVPLVDRSTYPTTLTPFNIFAYDSAGGTGSVTISGGAKRDLPLSAGGLSPSGLSASSTLHMAR